MEEFPPNNSTVAIKSCRFGTYLTACEDEELVRLDKVEGPNRLPRNSVWTLKLGPIGTVRFISCYDTFLAAKGIFRYTTTLCQDRFSNGYTRFVCSGWRWDRVGSTGKSKRYRLGWALSGLFLRAKSNGAVELESSLLFSTTAPEVYWSIEVVKLQHYQTIPSALPPSHGWTDPNDEKAKQKWHKIINNVIISNNNGSGEQNYGYVEAGNCYNQPHAIISGMNKNESGNQNNGNAQVGNNTTTIMSKELVGNPT